MGEAKRKAVVPCGYCGPTKTCQCRNEAALEDKLRLTEIEALRLQNLQLQIAALQSQHATLQTQMGESVRQILAARGLDKEPQNWVIDLGQGRVRPASGGQP